MSICSYFNFFKSNLFLPTTYLTLALLLDFFDANLQSCYSVLLCTTGLLNSIRLLFTCSVLLPQYRFFAYTLSSLQLHYYYYFYNLYCYRTFLNCRISIVEFKKYKTDTRLPTFMQHRIVESFHLSKTAVLSSPNFKLFLFPLF